MNDLWTVLSIFVLLIISFFSGFILKGSSLPSATGKYKFFSALWFLLTMAAIGGFGYLSFVSP